LQNQQGCNFLCLTLYIYGIPTLTISGDRGFITGLYIRQTGVVGLNGY